MAEQGAIGTERKGREKELVEMTYLLLGLGGEEDGEQRAKLPQHCHALPAEGGKEEDAEGGKEEDRESLVKEEETAAQAMIIDEEEEGELQIKEDDEEDEDSEMKEATINGDSPPTVRHSIDFLLNHQSTASVGDDAQTGKRRRIQAEDEASSRKRAHPATSEEAEQGGDEGRIRKESVRYSRRKEHLSPAMILASLATMALEKEGTTSIQAPPATSSGAGPQAVVSRLPPLRNVHHTYSLRTNYPAEKYGEETADEQLPGVSTLLQPATPAPPVPLAPRATTVTRPLPEKLKPLRLQERLAKQMTQPPQVRLDEPQYDAEDFAAQSYDYVPSSQSSVSRQHARLEVEDQLMMRKRRKRATADQVAFLEASFAENPLPDTETKNRIAQQLGMTTRRVTIWYQNKRARIKRELKKKKVVGSVPAIPSVQLPTLAQLSPQLSPQQPPQLQQIQETISPEPQQVLAQSTTQDESDPVANSIRPFLQRKAKQHAKVRR